MAKRKVKRSSSSSSAWSDLPESLLYTILTLLPSFRDITSFSSVCRSWRSSSSSASSSLFPPLLLCPLTGETSSSRFRSAPRRISGLRLQDPADPFACFPLTRVSVKSLCSRFLGCSHGQLIFLSSKRIAVVNPFTNSQLSSPVLAMKFNPEAFACLLTAPLSSSDSSLVVFSSGSFFQWRFGSSEWSDFGSSHKLSTARLITVNRQIYAIDTIYWKLYVSDLHPNLSLKDLQVDSLSERINISLIEWFVDLGGELLFLQLEPGEEIMKARSTAFKLENSSWIKMESLGNWAVFVGPNPGFPCLACENPERWGGRRNCIYFASSNGDGINGAWSEMELGEEIDTSDYESLLFMRNTTQWLSPLWIYPNAVR